MRIKCYPYQIVIDSEKVTVYKVSVVGHVPSVGTQYVEKEIGIVSNPDLAPHLTGEWIKHTLNERKVKELLESGKVSDEQTAIKAVEKNPPKYPPIPGVTVDLDIKWQNAKFGNRQKHLEKHKGKQDLRV